MKINVFAVSRRIVLLLQIVWVIGCMIVLWTETPYVAITYETEGPSTPFVTTRECAPRDAQEYRGAYDLADGKHVYITLCFKPHLFPNGSMLVPYKQDGGQWWGRRTIFIRGDELHQSP